MIDERTGSDAVGPVSDALLTALASAFTGPDGRPVPVERVTLSAAQVAGLSPAGGPALLVPDDGERAALLPGATAALVVPDGAGEDGDGSRPPRAVALVTR